MCYMALKLGWYGIEREWDGTLVGWDTSDVKVAAKFMCSELKLERQDSLYSNNGTMYMEVNLWYQDGMDLFI